MKFIYAALAAGFLVVSAGHAFGTDVPKVVELRVDINGPDGKLLDVAKYNKSTFPDMKACEAFVASDEGKASLDRLLAFLTAQVGNVTIKPHCEFQDAPVPAVPVK